MVGAWGAVIMGFFGAVFAVLTLAWQWHLTGILLVLPFLGFAAIGLAARAVLRQPGPAMAPSPAVARAIQWSSFGEGIGMFLAANIVLNLRRPEWLLPAMALVVGLHFLPIAMVARFRRFYLLAAALLGAALLGFELPAPFGGAVAGFAAAAALWGAALLAIRRERRFKASAAVAAAVNRPAAISPPAKLPAIAAPCQAM